MSRLHNVLQNVPEDLKAIVEDCLQIYPKDRPTAEQLLGRYVFESFQNQKTVNKSKVCEPFEKFTISELYHWWQLAGGDVQLELKKQGLIRSSPPILSLPK